MPSAHSKPVIHISTVTQPNAVPCQHIPTEMDNQTSVTSPVLDVTAHMIGGAATPTRPRKDASRCEFLTKLYTDSNRCPLAWIKKGRFCIRLTAWLRLLHSAVNLSHLTRHLRLLDLGREIADRCPSTSASCPSTNTVQNRTPVMSDRFSTHTPVLRSIH